MTSDHRVGGAAIVEGRRGWSPRSRPSYLGCVSVVGSERQTYWRRRLADSESKQSAAPAAGRLREVTAEIADLERRIQRQIANLEAEDATPALRQRIAARIAEPEEAVEDRRQRATALAQEAADAPPTAADLATALDQLPVLDRLVTLPHPELRTLFDSLRLQVAFQPGGSPSMGKSVFSPMNRQTAARKLRRSNPRPRQDSNLRTRLRRPALYPLSYGGPGPRV